MKFGVALGAGGARGLTHIGVLKALHKHKMYPDYIAGTSMGAVIAAAYAAGHSPDDIEKIASTTDWKNIVDFTVPKAGLIQGKIIENKIRKLVQDKTFKELQVPLRVVAYNLTKHERVIFKSGDVARAVRASSSIPGIFTPVEIDSELHIDGSVADPTPFDVVKEMGADVVLAVDLYPHQKKQKHRASVRKKTFLAELRQKFVAVELLNVKNYLFPDRFPRVFWRFVRWSFGKLLYPAKVMRIAMKRELPAITRVMYDTVGVLTNNLARERFERGKIDVKVRPSFGHLTWTDFDQVRRFVKIGEKAMERKLSELKKLL
jgi:predicted acylesterase/phospholipase RssA